MLRMICCGLVLCSSVSAFAEPCKIEYSQIPIYEKQILKVLDSPHENVVKNLERISSPLQCLTKMIQTGSGQMKLAW
jgi:hypothetical protein